MGLTRSLTDVVGAAHVLTDPDVVAGYGRDYTGRWSCPPRLVVRPADAEQIAGVLAVCIEHGTSIVPQGGNTGLVGGSTPHALGQVVLSLTRLDSVGAVDPATAQLTAGAGVSLAAVETAARGAGLDAALDFASRDRATVGGAIACDAGGARALRHGTARARVVGLEAVLPTGAIVSRLTGVTKDNAGYDLPALLVGSEGTLGVITQVRWRLEPRQERRVTMLAGLPSVEAVIALVSALRANAPSLESCDFFTREGLELVLAHHRRRSPVPDAPLYVIAECAARSDPTEELAAALEVAGVDDAAIADDTASRERLWSLREGHTDAVNAAGIPHKLDVGVPLAELKRFLSQVSSVARGSGAERVILWGHLGDGNVHVNLLGPPPDDEGPADAVLELALRCHGTISAEHGVGVAKVQWLERARGAGEVVAMRAIKRALDPDGLLNPGVVLA